MLTDDEIRRIYLRGFDDHREGDETPFFGHFLSGFRACEAATLALSSAAREDAERLDWLAANSWRIRWAKGYGDVPDTWFYESQAGTMIGASSLRAAIDAARSATKGEGTAP